jgi:hypothetical protein
MMRKVTTGVIVALGLLGIVAPAIAQTADPLGLIKFGALVPFFGGGQGTGETWLLEVFAPVGEVLDLHLVFFDSAGNRVGPSVGLPLTTNDTGFVSSNSVPSLPTRGLLAITSVAADGFTPVPLSNPIHARMYWFSPAQNFIVLEPISVQHAEAAGLTWNPLRTGATFFAPLENSTSASTLVLICPNQNVITAAFPPSRFPELVPHPVASGPTPLRIRVYDTNEAFLGNLTATCDVLSSIPLTSLSSIYSDATIASAGTYTEIEGGDNSAPFAFTGYLATRVSGVGELFGRLRNADKLSLRGSLTSGRLVGAPTTEP